MVKMIIIITINIFYAFEGINIKLDIHFLRLIMLLMEKLNVI